MTARNAADRNLPPVSPLVGQGFATASVEFRQTPVAPFPANVHDIKAAIRFLRGRAGEYGFDATRFAIAGTSSGGHLAALAGASHGIKELESELGDQRDESSEMHVIVSFYGAAHLRTILRQSTPHGLSVLVPALLGGLLYEPFAAGAAERAAHGGHVRDASRHDDQHRGEGGEPDEEGTALDAAGA